MHKKKLSKSCKANINGSKPFLVHFRDFVDFVLENHGYLLNYVNRIYTPRVSQ
jgi:hypothetical protein